MLPGSCYCPECFYGALAGCYVVKPLISSLEINMAGQKKKKPAICMRYETGYYTELLTEVKRADEHTHLTLAGICTPGN